MLNRMSVAVALLLVLVTCAAASSPPTIRLDSGTIQGYHNDGVDIYRGVPYASPPVGTLRFKNAIPPLNWTGHLDTTTDGAACPQRCKLPAAACPPIQDESCLYLNVFVPAPSSKSSLSNDRTLLPILFWIHGGDYYQGYGGGLLYDGTSLASNENVIVVSINYRLGALGFLYSGPNPKTQFTGNYGINDQQEALRWVQRNAKAFGGNPDQVTIFGQSAGGESVGTLLNMVSSKGLFSKAIAQSFPVGFPLREAAAAPSFTKVVAKDAGCDVSSPYETCMMNLTWEEVLAGAIKAETDVVAELGTFLDLFQPYGPTAGTPELPRQLMEGFLSGDALDLPLILGSVRQEGMIFIYEAFSKPVARAEEDALLVAIFGLKDIEKVLKQYPRNPAHYKDLRNHTAVIVTDALFQCPIRNIANTLDGMAKNGTRKVGSPYVYHFDHVLSFGDKFWLPGSPICLDTVCHGDELPLLFHPNISKIDAKYTKSEQILSKEMQSYWGNFAKTGVPGVASADGLNWPTYISGEGEMAMKFSTTNETVVDKAYQAKCQFWDDLGYKWILPH